MNVVERVKEREGSKYGGSAEGIRSHYDISNSFWPAVLGPSMTYSCALFSNPSESLEIAQSRKINWHIQASGANMAKSVLDIGCGWGCVVEPLSRKFEVPRIDGLTLSDAQSEYVLNMNLANVDVLVRNWADHKPSDPYDAIVSIGALEHFAKPQQSTEEKIAVYRDFFERCHGWLTPNGRMSLQTIAYGNMHAADASAFMNDIIFPESELPYLHELTTAAQGIFEVVAVRNDRFHYAATMEAWGRNLRKNKALATAHVGDEKVADMLRFFKMAAMGFRMGKQNLLRLALQPVNDSWSVSGRENWTDFAAIPDYSEPLE